MNQDHLVDLLRQTLPHVQDPVLVREIEIALRHVDTDADDSDDEHPGNGRRLPPWMDDLDGADLRMLTYPAATNLSLRGFDAEDVLAEVRERIDVFSRDPSTRADYPVEEWLQEQIAQQAHNARVRRNRGNERPIEAPPGTVTPEVMKFSETVTKMLGIRAPKRFGQRLAQLIAEHDRRSDPDGRHTLRRIADAMENEGYDLEGPISRVESPDGAPMTYIPLGSLETGTIMYDPDQGQFTLNSPKNWREGFAVEFVVSPH